MKTAAPLWGTFAIALLVYGATLAPTVTFEDSGELIAAAWTLGVPHQPGYPLFTLLGNTFSKLPLDPVAVRLNWMSAVLMALGAAFFSGALQELLSNVFAGATGNGWRSLAAGLGGLLAAFALETWEQAVITEVYGLHAALTGALFWVLMRWIGESRPRAKGRWFLLFFYLAGLGLSNHTTMVIILPPIVLFMMGTERSLLRNYRLLAGGVLAGFLGLMPYLYLPLASRRNPIMDWGNPENWENFWRTVSRHQYEITDWSGWDGIGAQLAVFWQLLTTQWGEGTSYLVIALAFLGLAGLFRRRMSLGWLFLALLLFTGPITTLLTNFDVSNPQIREEHIALVSVFYIPEYFLISFLAVVWSFVASESKLRILPWTLTGLAVLTFQVPLQNYRHNDMSRQDFAGYYIDNLFETTREGGVVFANWDPFYFPLNYAQYVEGRRPDLMVLDQQLMRRSWYIQWMQEHYGDRLQDLQPYLDNFLNAVRPFEEKKDFDPNIIQYHYMEMIRQVIKISHSQGRDVYFTYQPPSEVIAATMLEPTGAAFCVKMPGENWIESDPAKIKLPQSLLSRQSGNPDRMIKVFRLYFTQHFFWRARKCESAQRWEEAESWYRLTETSNPGLENVDSQVQAALERIKLKVSPH
ncbi:MAG: DUF2723 domain-containing protein [Calditrichaeota bacterium]|nr:DUF2723 domain-containing protein [Calditrichota bacterium]